MWKKGQAWASSTSAIDILARGRMREASQRNSLRVFCYYNLLYVHTYIHTYFQYRFTHETAPKLWPSCILLTRLCSRGPDLVGSDWSTNRLPRLLQVSLWSDWLPTMVGPRICSRGFELTNLLTKNPCKCPCGATDFLLWLAQAVLLWAWPANQPTDQTPAGVPVERMTSYYGRSCSHGSDQPKPTKLLCEVLACSSIWPLQSTCVDRPSITTRTSYDHVHSRVSTNLLPPQPHAHVSTPTFYYYCYILLYAHSYITPIFYYDYPRRSTNLLLPLLRQLHSHGSSQPFYYMVAFP